MKSLLQLCRIIYCFQFLLLPDIALNAQDPGLFKHIDSTSYSQFISHDWQALKKTTRLAFHNKIDYYYLRMRAGIAFYETGNYRIAEKNFLKALEFNNLDTLAYEYLYYSLLFAGKDREAGIFYENNN